MPPLRPERLPQAAVQQAAANGHPDQAVAHPEVDQAVVLAVATSPR